MKIRIDPLDALISKVIRQERPVCEYCNRRASTNVHHYHRRRIRATRYDERNLFALCFCCHRYLHEHPAKEVNWVKRKLGEQEYNALELRSAMYSKQDKKLIAMYYKQRLSKGNESK